MFYVVVKLGNKVVDVRRYENETVTITQDIEDPLNKFVKKRMDSTLGLTLKEIEVAGLIMEGLCNKEIGEKLFISVKTVKNHTANIYRKLDVSTRFELMSFLAKNNF